MALVCQEIKELFTYLLTYYIHKLYTVRTITFVNGREVMERLS